MAITFDAATIDTSFTGGSSATVSATIGGSADFLQLNFGTYASINGGTAGGISGVTWNGTSMVQKVTATQAADVAEGVAIYGLVAPATGTHNAVINFSPNCPFGGGVVIASWIGVDQTTPVDATASFASLTGTSPQALSVSVSAGGFASDCIQIDGAPTADGSQTGIAANVQGGDYIGASYKASASAMQWTFSGTHRLAHAIIAIKAASGGGGTTFIVNRMMMPIPASRRTRIIQL